MKTIVVVTTSYPLSRDGSEAAGSFVRDFAEELAGKARVIVLAPGEGNTGIVEEGRVGVMRYAGTGKPLVLLKPHNPLHWSSILRVLAAGSRALERLVALERVDYVFALWALPSGFWAWRVKRRTGIPYATWALGSDIWSLGRIPVVRNLLARVLADSDANFADGRQLCRDVVRLSSHPCTFLPSTRNLPVPPRERKAADGRPACRLAFLGRWHRNKGVDLLLASLRLLDEDDWKRIEEVRLFGGGPLEEQVRQEVQLLRQQGRNVVLGGYLDKAEAVKLFQWADYVLIPSRIESIPVVFSDAMKVGTPVLSTPVGDLGELIEQYGCGLAAAAASPSAFALLLKQGIRSDRQAFVAGVARAGDEFSLTATAAKFYASASPRA